MFGLRRREFITLLSGAAAGPIAARAQQDEPMRRIGVPMPLAADDPKSQTRLGAFLQGLQGLGWTIGRSLQVTGAEVRRTNIEHRSLP